MVTKVQNRNPVPNQIFFLEGELSVELFYKKTGHIAHVAWVYVQTLADNYSAKLCLII